MMRRRLLSAVTALMLSLSFISSMPVITYAADDIIEEDENEQFFSKYVPSFLKGDLNHDGMINIADVVAINLYINEQKKPTEEDHWDYIGDINNDGDVNVADLSGLTDISVGNIEAYQYLRTSVAFRTANMGALGVSGSGTSEETLVTANNHYSRVDNQIFELAAADSSCDYFYIKTSYTDKYWNINGNSTSENYNKLQIYDFYKDSDNMLFKLVKYGSESDGFYIRDKYGRFITYDSNGNVYATFDFIPSKQKFTMNYTDIESTCDITVFSWLDRPSGKADDVNGLYDGSEKGVDGIEVVLTSKETGSNYESRNLTGEGGVTGQYIFEDVPFGNYELSFTYNGYTYFPVNVYDENSSVVNWTSSRNIDSFTVKGDGTYDGNKKINNFTSSLQALQDTEWPVDGQEFAIQSGTFIETTKVDLAVSGNDTIKMGIGYRSVFDLSLIADVTKATINDSIEYMYNKRAANGKLFEIDTQSGDSVQLDYRVSFYNQARFKANNTVISILVPSALKYENLVGTADVVLKQDDGTYDALIPTGRRILNVEDGIYYSEFIICFDDVISDGYSKAFYISFKYITQNTDPDRIRLYSEIAEYNCTDSEGKSYYDSDSAPGNLSVFFSGERAGFEDDQSVSATIVNVEQNTVDLSDCNISINPNTYVYDDTSKQPTVTVKYGDRTLANGTDYTVAYTNNTNVGTATVTITGKGNYSGTVSKNFAISARSISSAAVTLSATSYTYDGTAKKPTVTVKDGEKTLASGTDYTVKYSDNINVGTATATITGVGNYKDAVNKTFTINPSKFDYDFIWGVDNWNFGNYDSVFTDYSVNAAVKERLYKDLRMSNVAILDVERRIEDWNSDTWGGSCWGFTVTQILNKQDDLKLSNYGGNNNIHDNSPTDNMKSVINFFQVSQHLSSFNQVIRESQYSMVSQKAYLNYLEEACQGDKLVNLTYRLYAYDYNTGKEGDSGGHSVLAYDVEDCIYESAITGLSYNKRILIADPNRLDVNDISDDACLYYNSSTGCWIIPYWNYEYNRYGKHFMRRCYYGDSSNRSRARGSISGIFGYDSLSKMVNLAGYSGSDHYIAGLQIDNDSQNTSMVAKVANSGNSNMNYAGDIDDGIIRYDTIFADDDPLTSADNDELYALWNPSASYTLSYPKPSSYNLRMDYEDIVYYADLTKSTYTQFKPDGSIYVRGSNAGYEITMFVEESEMVNDWYSLSVEGRDVDNVTLIKVSEGYKLSSDNLNNVKVSSIGTDGNHDKVFSTDYNSVLVHEVSDENGNTKLVVSVDTDSNGTYETPLENLTTVKIGDVNSDSKINAKDLLMLKKYLLNKSSVTIDTIAADINKDNKVNAKDLLYLKKYLLNKNDTTVAQYFTA